jgi:UDP-N-acetylglucosamine 2-epimerase (non-hydrolysing)
VLRTADVRLVIGTRPEAIKLAPVAHALAERGIQPSLILTGQHAALNPADFGLGDYPAALLDCPGEPDPYAHATRLAAALRPALHRGLDLLIVQGDTSSAFGAALAAFAAGVPVAHVEAGLRTHDSRLPWPEEEFRTAIDARSALLFAPTDTSADNLRRERVPGAVHVTGNTGIDALLAVLAGLPGPEPGDARERPSVLVTCHRRESWADGVRCVAAAVRALAGAAVASFDAVVPPNAHVAATMRSLLDGCANVALHQPFGHRELVERMRQADLILSDSGGMQEEAPALGVPLLVLRDKTERPEGIASGNMLLVGTDTDRIVGETTRLLSDVAAYAAMARPAFPYGDGRAAPRIATVIADWLKGKW